MKIKIISFLILSMIIHLSPLVTSCGPGRCGDSIVLYSAVEKANVNIYTVDQRSSNYSNEEPFDRSNLRIRIALAYPDSLNEHRYVNHTGSIVSSAYANSPCERVTEIRLTEYIKRVQILSFDEIEESTMDISLDFLAEGGSSELYLEVSDYLLDYEQYAIRLVYQTIPAGDSQQWIVRTTLSDNRVLSDTVNFLLK